MSSDLPVVYDRKPIGVDLKEGEDYYWCACGRSKSQPFCDGSHQGTSFEPLPFVANASKKAYLCLCKHTNKPPYCDGTHAKLPKAENENIKNEAVVSIKIEGTAEEPTLKQIHDLAIHGLEETGNHGELAAMGVPRALLPQWDDIQILAAQLAKRPLADEENVGTELIIGPKAKKPLVLKIPIFVSDMSFGALSEEAKKALAMGAEMVGTGICSGEGGMLSEEQQLCSRYFYELASAKFGFSEELLTKVQAFHFKAGQGAKTGVGGHLPASKVVGKIAQVRHLPEKQPAVSPATFADLKTPQDFRKFADRVREISGGIPVGFKISANHIEKDLEFALAASADYIILDGRGGGTGAAPLIIRDHISVPTIPALARARHFLNQQKRTDVTLIITGGLRLPADFVKAMALGADGIAIANSAIQAIGCIAARMCHTNNCPSGVATQKPELRSKINVEESSRRLARFLGASVTLMKVLARACGHDHLNKFGIDDLSTWKQEMADLTGIPCAGHNPNI